MQLLLVTAAHNGYQRGDILAVVPDIHAWGPFEVAAMWLAADAVAFPDGLPEDLVGVVRTTANFPTPAYAVAQFPSYRCDLNLADWQVEDDPDEPGATRVAAKRLWYLDLDALPNGPRRSLESPGGQASFGANRLSAVKNRTDNTPITDVAGWEDDITRGNSRHRHPNTNSRLWRPS